MASDDASGKPEEWARQQINKILGDAGWAVQDPDEFDPQASRGLAVREFPLEPGSTDYLLFVDRRPVGVIEVSCGRI